MPPAWPYPRDRKIDSLTLWWDSHDKGFSNAAAPRGMFEFPEPEVASTETPEDARAMPVPRDIPPAHATRRLPNEADWLRLGRDPCDSLTSRARDGVEDGKTHG